MSEVEELRRQLEGTKAELRESQKCVASARKEIQELDETLARVRANTVPSDAMVSVQVCICSDVCLSLRPVSVQVCICSDVCLS